MWLYFENILGFIIIKTRLTPYLHISKGATMIIYLQVNIWFQDETVWLTQAQGDISIKLNILREGLNLIIKKLTSFLIMSTKYAKMLTCQLEMSIK